MSLLLGKNVQAAMAQGVAFPCASCDKFWEGRTRGLPGTQCTSIAACGGPLSGDTFPHYRGEDLDWQGRCFACGKPADVGVRVAGKPRVLGCCNRHLAILTDYEPTTPLDQRGRRLLPGLALLPEIVR